ncbi:retention module-containing protein, partial [Motiliproteus sp. MSK22-1]|uniref:retention module-containing protein n=1 Tax=Motiliproteus sp. MSK22-1 TaxID=1897630 RepID=UPI00117C702E
MEGNSVQQGVEVTGANGKVVVVDEQGHPRTVVAGDQILAGETVLTMDDGAVRVATEQSPMIMESNSVGVVTPSSPDAPSSVLTTALSETDLDIEALQQAIEAGADPTELFEAAAAGQQGGAGTTSFVEIARTGQQLLAESGFDTETTGELGQAAQAANTLSAPATASIELDANITADDIVNAAESEGVVLITGVVGGDVTDGDVVSLIVNGNTHTGLVLDGVFSIEVPGVDLAGDSDKIVEASVTTTTGNQSGEATAADTEGYSVDTFVPTADISLDDDITADDVISIEESGGNVVITGVVGGDVVDGDTVTLVINGNTFTGPVDGGSFNIEVPAADLVADTDQTIDASVVTTTGSINGEASASDVESYATDLVQPEAEIVLDSNIAFDGVVNAAEEAGVIAISGSVGADVEEGDVVTLFVNGSTFEGLVDSDLRFSIDVPGIDLVADADSLIEASVTTTTGSVNGEATATDTETYGVDTEAPIATIILDANITADDIISQEESLTNIPISGSVGGDVQVGDVVTLTINGNTYTGLVDEGLRFKITVSGADLAADSDSTIEASVTATDPAGNSLTATDTEDYGADITAPEASIILDANITADDIVSVSEAAGDISVAGSVGGDVQEGDIVTLVINGRSFTGPVDENLRFSISVPGSDLAADPDKTIEASVTTSTGDVNGEVTATDTETYGIETTPTVVSVRNDTEVEGDVDLVHLVTLSKAPSDVTSFSFSLSPISASNSDYGTPVFSDGVVLSGGNVLVPAGVSSFTVSIPTIEDSLVEDSETLSLSVGGVSAIGTIIDDDIPLVDANIDPLARSDSFSTQAETAITTGSVLSNDNLGDVPTVIVNSSSSSANGGTVSYNGNGTFDYTPPSGFVGSDSFTYTIQDTDGQQSSATVTIVVGSVNNDPSAVADSYSTQEDTPVTTGNVLSNDDLGDTPTTVVSYDNSSTNGGTVSYNNDGTFNYTPAANFNGTDTFTYTIEDADGQQSTATVTMTVSEG